MEKEEINYVLTKDKDIIEQFLKIAPTKYLLSCLNITREYFDGEYENQRHKAVARWSFGKDKNYSIILSYQQIKDELDKRPNTRKPHSKGYKKELTCNSCGHKYIIKCDNNKVPKTFKVFNVEMQCKAKLIPDLHYGLKYIHYNDAIYNGKIYKIDYSNKVPVASFKCPECGEVFNVKLN